MDRGIATTVDGVWCGRVSCAQVDRQRARGNLCGFLQDWMQRSLRLSCAAGLLFFEAGLGHASYVAFDSALSHDAGTYVITDMDSLRSTSIRNCRGNWDLRGLDNGGGQ